MQIIKDNILSRDFWTTYNKYTEQDITCSSLEELKYIYPLCSEVKYCIVNNKVGKQVNFVTGKPISTYFRRYKLFNGFSNLRSTGMLNINTFEKSTLAERKVHSRLKAINRKKMRSMMRYWKQLVQYKAVTEALRAYKDTEFENIL